VRSDRKKTVTLVIVSLVLLLAAAFYYSISRPNQGKIINTPESQRAVPADRTLHGIYMTINYSGSYNAQRLAAKDNDLELYMLTANTNYDKRIAVSVSKLQEGNLVTNSAYNLRKTHTELYSNRTKPVDGGTASIWTKTDGSEETVFIPKGTRVAVLSFTTNSSLNELQTEVDKVLNTFKWKE
jgi:hypothetical protein